MTTPGNSLPQHDGGDDRLEAGIDRLKDDGYNTAPPVTGDDVVDELGDGKPLPFSLGASLTYGMEAFKKAPLFWFLVIPAIGLAVAIVSAFGGGIAGLVAGATAQDMGEGLQSGNIVPFIILCLIILVFSLFISSYVSAVQYNAAAWSARIPSVEVSKPFSFVTGTGAVYKKYVTVLGIFLAVFIPLYALSTGMAMVENYTVAFISYLAIMVFALLAGPIMSFICVHIVVRDKDSVQEKGIPWGYVWNTIKPYYGRLVVYQIVLGLLVTVGFLLFFVGAFYASGVVTNAYVYLYRSMEQARQGAPVA